MRPKTDHFHDSLCLEHLVDESMLNIDPPRVSASKISNELFVRWRVLVGILFE